MKLSHMTLAVAVAMGVAAPVRAQMPSMMQLGGGSYATNLVSPTTADTQIGRGMLMISQGMQGMGGMPMMTPGPGGNVRGLRLRLILTGVVSQGAPVTSSGNRLHVSGSLSSTDGSSQAVSVDQLFDVNTGVAVLFVPVALSSFTPPGVLEIADVQLTDTNGLPFGVPGLRISAPEAVSTRPMTPGMGPHATMTPGMGGFTMTPGMGPHATMTPRMGPHMGAERHRE